MLPINNNFSMLMKFREFAKSMQGKNPQQILDELISSGKVTQAQVDNARKTAEQFKGFLK